MNARCVPPNRRLSRRPLLLCTSIAVLLLHVRDAPGAEFTWDSVSGTWSTAANWTPDAVPVGAADTELNFLGTGSAGYSAIHDLGPLFSLHRLTLNSSATVVNNIVAAGSDSLSFTSPGLEEAVLEQLNTGAFNLNVGVDLNASTIFSGTATSGLVSIAGPISGFGFLAVNGGQWQFRDVGSSWSGETTITGGARLELLPEGSGNANVDLTGGAAGIIGTSGTIFLNNGTLKLTPLGTGNVRFGTNRTISFGTDGGLLDITNSTGGNIPNAGGDNLAIVTTAGAAAPAVIRWNGGAVGLSSNAANNGDWRMADNVLRIRSLTNAGPVRFEVTNGALLRGGFGGTGTTNIPNSFTLRGVSVNAGGDPTSGPAGLVPSATSKTTGRYGIDTVNILNHSGGLRLEGAVQIHNPGKVRAIDGNITVAGMAGGEPGYVAFNGRSTGQAMISTILDPAGGASTNGQHVLWIGQGGNDTLTIEDGGIAVFDSRLRVDQANHHGVLLDARAVLQPGGTLRLAQSVSNFSAFTGLSAFTTNASVGDITLRGDLEGQGNAARESVLDLYLPAPSAAGTTANGVPTPLGDAPPGASTRPFGGLVAEASHGLIINGTGFAGLRINALPRPDRLFSATGLPGGAAIPDPTAAQTKLDGYLTPDRIASVSGSGGYLTVAPANAVYLFPNAEWAPSVPVGLKVANHNGAGVDLQFDAAKSNWGHNLAIDAGAELSTGSAPFTLSAGTLHGAGTVSGTGGLTIAAPAFLSPGLSSVGTITLGSLTIDGTVLLDVTNAPTNDVVSIGGNLTLNPTSVIQVTPGSTFNNATYTVMTYSGSRTGAFGAVAGLPIGYNVNYDVPGQVRLVFSSVQTRTWNGSPGNIWSANPADANWKGPAAFNNGDLVVFDDTASGSTNVTVNGNIQAGQITVNNATKNYVITAPAGNGVGGSAVLLKSGAATLELQGIFSYGNGTTITAGTLRLSNNDALPNVGIVTVASGATLDLAGRSDTIGDLNVGGTVTTGNLQVGAVTLSDAGSIAANLTLGGNLTKSGLGGTSIAGTVNLGGITRTFTIAAGNDPDLVIAGGLSNGGLIKAGDGILALNASATYTGPTSVVGGTLRAGAVQAIGTGDLTVGPGATVAFGGFAHTVGALNGDGQLLLGGAALTIDSPGTSVFGGTIDGAGSLTKNAAGTLTLSGVNNFDGGLTINAGRVVLASANAAGLGNVRVKPGAALQLGANVFNAVTIDGGTITSQTGASVGSGEWNLIGDSTIQTVNAISNASTDVIFTGSLRDEGDINLLAASGQANADQGQGFRLRGTTASDYSGTVTVNQRAKFEIQMSSSSSPNPFGSGRVVLMAGTSTGGLGGTYSQIQPRLAAGAETYALGHPITVTGQGYVNVNVLGGEDVVAQFGQLQIGGGQILGANKNDVTNRTVEFTSVQLTGGNAEFRAYDPLFGVQTNASRGGANIRLGAISETTPGAGLIVRSTAPYFTEITGTASYTGATQVQTGKLTVGATASLASSSSIDLAAADSKLDVTAHGNGYAIPASQTLSGRGDWDGRILLDGTLAPGTGIATISGDDLVWNGGGRLRLELSNLDGAADRVMLTGAFEKGTTGAFQFDFEAGGRAGQTYTLLQFASTSFTVADFTHVDLGPGLSASFQLNPTELLLVVVPEPGPIIAAVIGGVIVLCRRRHRRAAGSGD